MKTDSSTEAELVGVSDVIHSMIWTDLFIAVQGYTCTTHLHQDNEAAQRLEINGKRSSSQHTRNLNIKHFHITDQIKQG